MSNQLQDLDLPLRLKFLNVVFDKFRVRAGYGESETPLSYNDVKTKAFHKTI